MQFRNHLFITRQWKKDKKEFAWKLNYINHTDSPYQLLMFPEGTDLTPEHKAKYDLFADANSWPRYDYCLHPKSTGFIYTLNALRKHKQLVRRICVVDVVQFPCKFFLSFFH